MSRIGNEPIQIPEGVTLEISQSEVMVRGPKGTQTVTINKPLLVEQADKTLLVKNPSSSKNARSLHGLVRSLIANAVVGTTKGWEKTLELVGVGYRAQGGGNEITLNIGFSHPVKFTAPSKDIAFTIKDNTKITIAGIDKKMVGETAAKIRSLKPPEPYKGKGIRYTGEVVRKKAGKAVKAAGAS